MISVRRAAARQLEPVAVPQHWHTFGSAKGTSAHDGPGFHVLEHLDEVQLPPDEELPHRSFARAEWLTYVLEGSLSYEDERGQRGVLRAGGFQRVSSAANRRHREWNLSRTENAHFFQCGLRASTETTPGHQERHFSVAARRNVLCLVASPAPARGILRFDQDARLYSACIDAGHHLVHELTAGRVAWLHVIRGSVKVMEEELIAGDGAAVSAERAVSVTATEEAEVLLFDVGEHPTQAGNGVAV